MIKNVEKKESERALRESNLAATGSIREKTQLQQKVSSSSRRKKEEIDLSVLPLCATYILCIRFDAYSARITYIYISTHAVCGVEVCARSERERERAASCSSPW